MPRLSTFMRHTAIPDHLHIKGSRYPIGGQADAEVQATFGKTDYEVAGDYSGGGATIRTHVIDFLILADELGHEPQASDVIVADGRKYEVMDLAGEGAWRWSDPYRTTYRIHTKDTGPPEAPEAPE